ncbi:MAG: metal ABC transporter permease [bacterium]|nr:metal ABC transporter permease [bacterium]
MDITLLTAVSGVLVAMASGLVGSFLVLRRMTLLSDALSHVALPGIALGVLFHVEPIVGGLLSLLIGILIIWGVEDRTRLAVESVTGVLFVTALALGATLAPDTELLEAFFGNVERVTASGAFLQAGVALLIIVVALRWLKPLLITSIAPDLAVADKVPERWMKLLLLMLIALTITIGISFVGVLLMSGLSIIPAATARNLSRTYKSFVVITVILAIVAMITGLEAHLLWGLRIGTVTVFVSAFLFVASLFAKRRT